MRATLLRTLVWLAASGELAANHGRLDAVQVESSDPGDSPSSRIQLPSLWGPMLHPQCRKR
jgi:hypothetical protein